MYCIPSYISVLHFLYIFTVTFSVRVLLNEICELAMVYYSFIANCRLYGHPTKCLCTYMVAAITNVFIKITGKQRPHNHCQSVMGDHNPKTMSHC